MSAQSISSVARFFKRPARIFSSARHHLSCHPLSGVLKTCAAAGLLALPLMVGSVPPAQNPPHQQEKAIIAASPSDAAGDAHERMKKYGIALSAFIVLGGIGGFVGGMAWLRHSERQQQNKKKPKDSRPDPS